MSQADGKRMNGCEQMAGNGRDTDKRTETDGKRTSGWEWMHPLPSACEIRCRIRSIRSQPAATTATKTKSGIPNGIPLGQTRGRGVCYFEAPAFSSRASCFISRLLRREALLG